jgi:hypothetical protein
MSTIKLSKITTEIMKNNSILFYLVRSLIHVSDVYIPQNVETKPSRTKPTIQRRIQDTE